MQFNPDMMLMMLHQTHVHMTANSPLTYHDFPLGELENLDKLCDLDANQLVKESYEAYKETDTSKSRGTVDMSPTTWFKFFIYALSVAKENEAEMIRAPNGCCTVDACPVKLFYQLIYQTIQNHLAQASDLLMHPYYL